MAKSQGHMYFPIIFLYFSYNFLGVPMISYIFPYGKQCTTRVSFVRRCLETLWTVIALGTCIEVQKNNSSTYQTGRLRTWLLIAIYVN